MTCILLYLLVLFRVWVLYRPSMDARGDARIPDRYDFIHKSNIASIHD